MTEHTVQITAKEYLAVFETYLRSKAPQIFEAMNGEEASVVNVKPHSIHKELVDIVIKIGKGSDE